jgi:hypothetical protein
MLGREEADRGLNPKIYHTQGEHAYQHYIEKVFHLHESRKYIDIKVKHLHESRKYIDIKVKHLHESRKYIDIKEKLMS